MPLDCYLIVIGRSLEGYLTTIGRQMSLIGMQLEGYLNAAEEQMKGSMKLFEWTSRQGSYVALGRPRVECGESMERG